MKQDIAKQPSLLGKTGFPQLSEADSARAKLRSEGVKVKLVLEFDNIETVKRAVEIENGVSLVPEKAVRDEVEAGLLATMEFSDRELRRPLGALIRRSASCLTRAA